MQGCTVGEHGMHAARTHCMLLTHPAFTPPGDFGGQGSSALTA